MLPKITLYELNTHNNNTLAQTLGIEYTAIGADYLTAKMPVDSRTKQPFNLLHGGASAALAETLGSHAGNLIAFSENKKCVGLELNINHIRSETKGWVYGTAKICHIGKSTQIWDILIKNEEGKLLAVSRLTLMVLAN